jgi:signal transduction histidine kinase
VLEDFVKDIGWIWIPFVIVLLVVNLVVARIGLAPLHTAASEAATIGPRTTSVRLTEEGLPRDVHALVTAVNRALDRLEEALDSQRHFISDAAHELRTPVSILKAHAAILPDVKEHATLVEEINALERLVNQLLDSARLDVLELRPDQIADLNDVAKEVATQLGPTAINAGRSIEVVACDEPVRISGARDYLCQALRNIVENAIRHTPESTTVRIEVTLPPAISVTDHGPGVPPDNREAIFKRFWQGRDSRGGGAGLGMEIAARTAAAHGGTISVDDAPGGGAIFTMRFRAWTGN